MDMDKQFFGTKTIVNIFNYNIKTQLIMYTNKQLKLVLYVFITLCWPTFTILIKKKNLKLIRVLQYNKTLIFLSFKVFNKGFVCI